MTECEVCGWDHLDAVNPHTFGSVEFYAWQNGREAGEHTHAEGWQTPESNVLDTSPFRSRRGVTIAAWVATGTPHAQAERHADAELAQGDYRVSTVYLGGYFSAFPEPSQLPAEVE